MPPYTIPECSQMAVTMRSAWTLDHFAGGKKDDSQKGTQGGIGSGDSV